MLFSNLDLNEELLSAVKNEGFTKATPIQHEAIPHCLQGKDIIATAGTGTGKTAAFALPLIQHLMKTERSGKSPRALILTPTRELAEQIFIAIQRLTKGINLSVTTVYGGVSMKKQESALRKGKDIVIACPGRLLDHMRQKNTRLDGVDVLVLDEADRMLDMGFLPDVKRIIADTPTTRQTLLFSATFGKGVTRLSNEILYKPVRVAIGLEEPPETIDHSFYPISQDKKNDLLKAVLRTDENASAIVFTRTKHRANRLSDFLNANGFRVSAIHGNKSQAKRKHALDSFRKGKISVLVATDVAARGIDIENVSHVINFDIPETAESYIHRIGRTGRAERKGMAMSFVTMTDRLNMRQIERALGNSVRKDVLSDFDYGSCDPHNMFSSSNKESFAKRRNVRRFSPRKKNRRHG